MHTLPLQSPAILARRTAGVLSLLVLVLGIAGCTTVRRENPKFLTDPRLIEIIEVDYVIESRDWGYLEKIEEKDFSAPRKHIVWHFHTSTHPEEPGSSYPQKITFDFGNPSPIDGDVQFITLLREENGLGEFPKLMLSLKDRETLSYLFDSDQDGEMKIKFVVEWGSGGNVQQIAIASLYD